jgi:MFS family permease
MFWDVPSTVDLSMLALMVIRAFHGLSIAAFVVAYSALVHRHCSPAHRGELIGYMSLVNPVGLALGPALGGFLYEAHGFFTAFLVMGVLGVSGFGPDFTSGGTLPPDTAWGQW